MEVVLSTNQLVVGYDNRKPLVSCLDLSFIAGKSYTLLGENGVGKTSFFKTLLGLLKPISGKIIKPTHITFGYVPQTKRLQLQYPLTAKDVLQMPFGKIFPFRINLENSKLWKTLVIDTNLEPILKKQISDCSGGELQKIMITRALLTEPKILFLDEPMNALDPESRERYKELFKSYQSNQQMTLFMITHNPAEDSISEYDHVFEINAGILRFREKHSPLIR